MASCSENPRAHKNQSGASPRQKITKYPPPPIYKTRNFFDRHEASSDLFRNSYLNQNCLQWGRSNLVGPTESPKLRLLNWDFGNILSIFPRKNGKTQSALIFLSPDPGNLLSLIFRDWRRSSEFRLKMTLTLLTDRN